MVVLGLCPGRGDRGHRQRPATESGDPKQVDEPRRRTSVAIDADGPDGRTPPGEVTTIPAKHPTAPIAPGGCPPDFPSNAGRSGPRTPSAAQPSSHGRNFEPG